MHGLGPHSTRCRQVLLLERDAPLLEGLDGPGGEGQGQPPASLADASAEVFARRKGVPQWTQPHVSAASNGRLATTCRVWRCGRMRA